MTVGKECKAKEITLKTSKWPFGKVSPFSVWPVMSQTMEATERMAAEVNTHLSMSSCSIITELHPLVGYFNYPFKVHW